MDQLPTQPRRYPIRGYDEDFVTGITRSGSQVLMGLLCPHVVAYFFSPEGALERRELRLWRHPAPRMAPDGPYRLSDPAFRSALAQQIQEWHEELGWRPGAISVQPFFDDDAFVGIEDLPEHLQELDESADASAELLAERADWLARGSFVLYWAKDYFMSRDGAVEST